MRLFLIVFLLSLSFAYAQNNADYTMSVSKADSTTIANWRIKMAQLINPYPDSALFYSKKIKAFTTELAYGPGIVDAEYLIGQCYKRMQQLDIALAYFRKTLELSKRIDYPIGIARAYNSLCRTYYLTGEMEASIDACEKAIATTRTYNDPNNMIFADSHTALATAYARQNQLEEALKALLVVDSVHKLEALRPDVIAAAYQNLGNIYLDLKDYNASEEYYLKANDEFEKLPGNASYYLNTTHIYLGRVYLFKNNLRKADSLLQLSYVFFSGLKDERTVAEISTYIGEVKKANKQYVEAERFFKESYSIHKKNERYYEASLNVIELAKLAVADNKPAESISLLDEVSEMNAVTGNSLIAQQTYELYADSYAKLGNYRQAFRYNELYQHLKDSLQQLQSADKIKEIEAIYQTESRDREIELLTSQNALAEEQKANQRNLFIGGIALTTLLGLFFFVLFRNRQQTNNKLRELDKAKSAFFANISHDLRTPLTLIKGPIEDQLEQQDISNRERKNLELARSNTERLESLVEQLLALSKLESGNLELKVRPGNLSNFVAVQASAFEFSAREMNTTFNIHLERYEDSDWFDRDALEKILFNLLGNAFKYGDDGGTIELKGSKRADMFELSISNTGSYIRPGHIEKIFDRFYQADPELSGSGIGLALTKELAELHKGSISVESKENGMTIFRLSIPVARSTYNEQEILTEALRDPEVENNTELKPEKEVNLEVDTDAPLLLVVDDNPEIRSYLSSILETNYRVITASEAVAGLELAKEQVPDIIISDVMMPGMDGFEFSRQIKQDQLTSHIPLMLLSAKSHDSDRLSGMESGVDAYLTKPFNSQLLIATLDSLINNRRKLQARFAQEVILRPKDIAISSADEQFLERLQVVMDKYLTDPEFSSERFSSEMAVSRMQLHRKLKAIAGQSTTAFLRSQRLKLAANLLRKGDGSISEVAYSVGFNDPSYFTKCFKQEFGCAPTDFNNS